MNDRGSGKKKIPASNATATPMGFEPTRAEPIGLAGRRLDHSAKVSWKHQNQYPALRSLLFYRRPSPCDVVPCSHTPTQITNPTTQQPTQPPNTHHPNRPNAQLPSPPLTPTPSLPPPPPLLGLRFDVSMCLPSGRVARLGGLSLPTRKTRGQHQNAFFF